MNYLLERIRIPVNNNSNNNKMCFPWDGENHQGEESSTLPKITGKISVLHLMPYCRRSDSEACSRGNTCAPNCFAKSFSVQHTIYIELKMNNCHQIQHV